MRTAENFSIVCGTGACNAECPFCVSKMTGLSEIGLKPQPVNWRNFDKAAQIAKDCQVGSVVITGKGEPTLFPDQITDYLDHLKPHSFPLIDLQTNAVMFDRQAGRFNPYLERWYDQGLAFIAISIVHFDQEENRKIYTPRSKDYIDLARVTDRLHKIGYSTRFSVTMFDGGIDSPEKVSTMINYAKKLSVEQLTLRRVAKPGISENPEIGLWAAAHLLRDEQMSTIKSSLDQTGSPLLSGGHGSIIYDVSGQNVCLTNALTLESDPSKIRQVIFFPNGRVRFDWQYSGASIL